MTTSWFGSDLHFGHKNIQKFRHHVVDELDNREIIRTDWKQLVTKRDTVYILGDAAFTMEGLDAFKDLPGRKILIRGNHDLLDTAAYLKVFEEVYGLLKYKEFWLSHAPIHPDELRGKMNLHGHVHYETIRKPFNPVYDIESGIDLRYFNCCVENVHAIWKRSLVNLDELRKHIEDRNRGLRS
jgi:calcineurin-like phosphoesterase family protein